MSSPAAECVEARSSGFFDGSVPDGSDEVIIYPSATKLSDMPAYVREEAAALIAQRQNAANQTAELLGNQRTYAAHALSLTLGKDVVNCDAVYAQAHTVNGHRVPNLDVIKLSYQVDDTRRTADLMPLRGSDGNRLIVIPQNQTGENEPLLGVDLPAGTLATLAQTNLELLGARGFHYRSYGAVGMTLANEARETAELLDMRARAEVASQPEADQVIYEAA